MSLSKIMTTKLIHVSPTETIGQMHQLFISLPIHHLLVMEGPKLVGIVSDRDVLKHLSPFSGTKLESEKDRFAANLPASRIMKTDVVTVFESQSLRQVAKVMLENALELLPVVNDDFDVRGVVSWRDILRYLID